MKPRISQLAQSGATNGQVITWDSATSKWVAQTATATDPAAVPKSLYSAKGVVLIASAASTPAALTVGSDGQVLTADSTQTTGVKWAAASSGFADPTTTKGDLIVHGTTTTRLAVGSDGQVLTADSTQTLGVKWAVSGGGVTICQPQGTLQRRYLFDSTTESFTVDTGTISNVSGKLQVAAPAASNSSALEPSSAANVADGELYADVFPTTPDSGGQYDTGVIFRASDASNHYMLAVRSGTSSSATSQFELYKKVSGTYTSLSATPGTTTLNNIIRVAATSPFRVLVRFVGTQIFVYYSETLVMTVTDGTFTTGRCGVRAAGGTGGGTHKFDNVSVYSLSSTLAFPNYP